MKTHWQRKFTLTTLALLMPVLMTGCASYKVVSEDREVVRVKAGQSLKVEHDGWLVPDATWLDINRALGDKVISFRVDGLPLHLQKAWIGRVSTLEYNE